MSLSCVSQHHDWKTVDSRLSLPSNQPQVYLEPFSIVVRRFAPVGTLTSMHPFFLRSVLNYRAYDIAKDVLYTDITDVDKSVGWLR